mmetsp:Transcript_15926/g.23295  ORF Transcript_15926/g.23295 Transcript_15926/m.23295 type:complete len:241 (+) Transcript_15926:833-1555(+)
MRLLLVASKAISVVVDDLPLVIIRFFILACDRDTESIPSAKLLVKLVTEIFLSPDGAPPVFNCCFFVCDPTCPDTGTRVFVEACDVFRAIEAHDDFTDDTALVDEDGSDAALAAAVSDAWRVLFVCCCGLSSDTLSVTFEREAEDEEDDSGADGGCESSRDSNEGAGIGQTTLLLMSPSIETASVTSPTLTPVTEAWQACESELLSPPVATARRCLSICSISSRIALHCFITATTSSKSA